MLLGFSDDVDSLAVGIRFYKVMTLRKLPSLTTAQLPGRQEQLEVSGWLMCNTHSAVVFRYVNCV